jgi:hypothetical protein
LEKLGERERRAQPEALSFLSPRNASGGAESLLRWRCIRWIALQQYLS